MIRNFSMHLFREIWVTYFDTLGSEGAASSNAGSANQPTLWSKLSQLLGWQRS